MKLAGDNGSLKSVRRPMRISVGEAYGDRAIRNGGSPKLNWKELFFAQHASVHSTTVGRASRSSIQNLVVGGLSEEQLRLRPLHDQNSVAWLVWHMTRCEDVAINVAIADRQQVLNDGWGLKLGSNATTSELA